MMRALALVLLLGGCVGDATSGGDAGVDASNDVVTADVQGDVATSDAGTDASDAGSCPPPSTSLTANCSSPMVACLRQSQADCESASSCTYPAARQLLCGSVADCDGGAACCTVMTTITSTGCPQVLTYNGTIGNVATKCSAANNKQCAGGDHQVCLTTAECATGTCNGAVWDVNGSKVVSFGVCQ
jgi:hypothetical protein